MFSRHFPEIVDTSVQETATKPARELEVSMNSSSWALAILAALSVLVCANAQAGTLHSAIVPIFESDSPRRSNNYFSSLINDTDTMARNCRIEIDDKHGLKLSYWTTDQTDNFPTGDRDTPADLWPRSVQSFGLSLSVIKKPERSTGSIYPTFVCDEIEPAIQVAGTNDVQLATFDFTRLPNLTDEEMEAMQRIVEKIEANVPGEEPELTEEEMELLIRLQSEDRLQSLQIW